MKTAIRSKTTRSLPSTLLPRHHHLQTSPSRLTVSQRPSTKHSTKPHLLPQKQQSPSIDHANRQSTL